MIKEKVKKSYYIVTALVLLLVFIILIILFYKNCIEEKVLQPKSILSVDTNMDLQSTSETLQEEIKEDKIYEQEIKMIGTEFDGISILINNVDGKSTGYLQIALKEKGKNQSIEDWEINLAEFPYYEFYNLFLKSKCKIQPGDIYVLRIQGERLKEVPVKLQQVNRGGLAGKLYINGVEKKGICFAYRVNNGTCSAIKYFYMIVSLVLGTSIIFIVYLLIRKAKIEVIAFAVILLLGNLYALVIPPYVVPDEASHFVTAYAQSSILLNKNVLNEEGKIIAESDAASYIIRNEIPNVSSYVRYIRGIMGRSERIMKEDEIELRTPLKTEHLGYIPQIIGITFGRIVGLNDMQLFFLGRMFAVFFYAFIMYWAVKFMPFCKIMLLIVSILPMTLQQAASFNWDSVLNGVLFFLFAYFLYLIFEKEKIGWKTGVSIVCLSLIIIPIKFIYVAIELIGLLVDKAKFGGKKNKIFFILGILFSNILIIFIIWIGPIVRAINPATRVNNVDALSTLEYYTVLYVIKHPFEACNIFFNTLVQKGSFFVDSMIGKYLGWLSIEIENIIIVGFIVLLFMSMLQKNYEKYIQRRQKKIIVGVGILVCLLVFISFLISETYIGSDIILGIQGRYFLPVLPALMLIVQNKTIVLKRSIDNYIIMGSVILQSMTVMEIVKIVVNG